MPETNADHMIDIDKRLNELPPIPSERCIFGVQDRLRNENKKAYEPEVVAIGPYHRDNGKLQPMEEFKLRYLKQLLNRRTETGAEKYMVAMRESEQKARRFYADPISLDSNEFAEMMLLFFFFDQQRKSFIDEETYITYEKTSTRKRKEKGKEKKPSIVLFEIAEMMLLDSCFILEVLRGDEMMPDHIQIAVRRDLVLFENQLPFFVVMKLFNMTKDSTDSLYNLVGMFAGYFVSITPGILVVPPENPTEEDTEHLLAENSREDDIFEHLLAENQREHDTFKHLVADIEHLLSENSMVSQRNNVGIKDKSLKSAKQLQEAGIKFKKIEGKGRNLFDIRFVNGTIEIPTLIIQDDTESFFRNLIAYEQYRPDSWSHFTTYHKFMDYLVNTSEDVKILAHDDIILSLLGDNQVVAAMLNKLGNSVIVSYVGYEEVYNSVNEHCKGQWNLWLAILRRKYFNNPWALISFLAAAVLLLLALLQTILSILSFQESN